MAFFRESGNGDTLLGQQGADGSKWVVVVRERQEEEDERRTVLEAVFQPHLRGGVPLLLWVWTLFLIFVELWHFSSPFCEHLLFFINNPAPQFTLQHTTHTLPHQCFQTPAPPTRVPRNSG